MDINMANKNKKNQINKLKNRINDLMNHHIWPPIVLDDACVTKNSLDHYKPMSFYDDVVIQEKENNMQYVTLDMVPCPPARTRDEAKDYSAYRIGDIASDKRREARAFYGVDGIFPKTSVEMTQWLKDGNYRIDAQPADAEEDDYFDWSDSFHWGKDKPDRKAYEAELAAIDVAHIAAKDVISIMTDEKARLAAVQDFKAQTFH
jgi:hypothetical protein